MAHSFCRRAFVLLLLVAFFIGIFPAPVFASDSRYTDTSGHWASPAIERWSDEGVLHGHAGAFRPDAPITRAEMATVLANVNGYIEVGDNPFSDIGNGKWYDEPVIKLATAGILAGYEGKAWPEDNMTREEAVTLLSRAFDIPSVTDPLQSFADRDRTSAWALGHVDSMRALGYLSGKPGGQFDPKSPVTRAEVVTLLDRLVNAFYNAKGEYSSDVGGNAVVRTDGVTLNGVNVSGNLYLAAGVGAGDVILNEIVVAKNVHVHGGGPNSIVVAGGQFGGFELNSRTNTHLKFIGEVKTGGVHLRNTGSVTRDGVTVAFDAMTGVMSLSGDFDLAVLGTDGTMTISVGGMDFTITPPEGLAMTATLVEGSRVKEMRLNGPLHVAGTGSIGKLAILSSGTMLDAGLNVPLGQIVLGNGIAATIGSQVHIGTGDTLGADDPEDTGASFSDTVTVSFQSNGGSAIPRIQVQRGETLAAVPMPVKQNHAFVGWYTDSTLASGFFSDTPIARDMTLYAGYAERDGNMTVHVAPDKYVEDCDPNHTITIHSPIALTAGNLAEYVQLDAFGADVPALHVTGDSGAYTLSPQTPYVAGTLYKLSLKNESLSFSAEDVAVRNLSFAIHKDETEIVALVDTLKRVLWTDVTDLGEGAYTVPAGKYDIETGDTVCLWDGVYDDRMKYRTVVLASPIAGEDASGDMLLLNTQGSTPSEVYVQLDVYTEQAIPIGDYLDQIDVQKIVQSVKYGAGAGQVTAILNQAIAQSPTIKTLAANTTYFRTPSETAAHRDIPVELLFADVEDLEVSCTVGGTDNANFPSAMNPDVAASSEYGKDYSPVLTLTLNYSTVLYNKVQIDAEITIKEYLSASVQGGGAIDGLNDYDFNYAVNTYAQTDIFMSVLVKSVSQSPEYAYSIDVTEEINKLMQGDAGADAGDDPAEILKKVLGDKGDYIDLVEANIIDIPVKIPPDAPVAETHLKLDFVIKANFAAGISSETTLLTARQIGIAGRSDDGYLAVYDNVLPGNHRYAMDLYIAGYAGFKAGLKGTMTISLLGLEDVGKVGASLELGAYIDAYGFAHATILKTYANDYIFMGVKEITLDGALYLELGLYQEMELFAESEIFSARVGVKVLDIKIPLLSVGDRYVLSRFLNDAPHILMNTESLPLTSANGLFAAEFIDMKTGEKVTGSFSDASRFGIGFSSRYLYTQDNAIRVDKALLGENIKRIDATAYIYYKGGTLTFSGPREIYYDINGEPVAINSPKTVNLTWIDSSIDASRITGMETVKATYVANVDGKETILDERVVLLAEIPGAIDLSTYYWSHKITGYENDFNKAIVRDTTYKINLTPYQRLISYITYYDIAWHFEVYPVNSGETPVPSVKYDTSPTHAFTGWFVASGTYGYSGGSNYAGDVIPLKDVLRYGNDDVFHGLDTSRPLFSRTGTLAECYDAWYNGAYQGETFNSLSLARYEAAYQRDTHTITYQYLPMEYTAMGTTVRHAAWGGTETCQYGEPVIVPGTYHATYYGCEMLGWDTDGNGTVDYDPENPVIATRDMVFTAVMKVKTFEVTVLDPAGNAASPATIINIGNMPDVLRTTPVSVAGYPSDRFLYWEIAKGGGAFSRWYSWSTVGLYENWTIRPVYNLNCRVTFLNYYGSPSDTSTITVPIGSRTLSDIVPVTPAKPMDQDNEYQFTGWQDQTGATHLPDAEIVLTGDMTFTALFTAIPNPFVYLHFSTPHGELSTGGTTHAITTRANASDEVANAYLEANRAFAPVYTNTFIYSFNSWGSSTAGQSILYTAQWDGETRYYTVTYHGNGGLHVPGGQDTVTVGNLTYESQTNLPGAADFVKEDVYNTYELTGWTDQTGAVHLPGETCTVSGDMTFTAVYAVLAQKTYTITFDANGGVFPAEPGSDFPEGQSTFEMTCVYGEVLSGIQEPAKPAGTVYTYTFTGWTPSIVPVVGNATYTAQYARTSNTELPTGLLISDGVTTEDLNMGTIPGYTYTFETNRSGYEVPTLTITGGGLTVSGIPDVSGEPGDLPDVVRIFVASDVTDVGFDNLELWTNNDHLIYVEGGSGSVALTVTISGTCSLLNYGSYSVGGYRYSYAPIESERDLILIGEDASPASLHLETGAGASAMICGGQAIVQELTLTIDMIITQESVGIVDNWRKYPAAFHNGRYPTSHWRFIDADVTVDTDGRGFGNHSDGVIGNIEIIRSDFSLTSALGYIDQANSLTINDSVFTVLGKPRRNPSDWSPVEDYSDGILAGDVAIIGASAVSITADASEIAALRAAYLAFFDFTGSFGVSFLPPVPSEDPAIPTPSLITLPAVWASSGISFWSNDEEIDSATFFDMAGAVIREVTNEEVPPNILFYSFTDSAGVPLSSITVVPK